jgi:hypothetical protein
MRGVLLLALPLAACGNANMVPVKAEIASIERQCSFRTVAEVGGSRRTVNAGEMKACDTTDEFDEIRRHPSKRTSDIVGKGKLTVSFTLPGDDDLQTAEIRIDGRDDAFYARRGDTIRVWVDKTNPAKARL